MSLLSRSSSILPAVQGWPADHPPQLVCCRPPARPRRRKHHVYRPIASSANPNGGGASSSGPRASAAAPRSSSNNTNDSISPARLLHTLEFAAIAIAAVGQAAILVSTAVCQWRQTQQLAELQEQLSAVEGSLSQEGGASSAAHSDRQHLHQHKHHHQQQQQQQLLQVPVPPVVPGHSGLHLLTGSALVVGLLCGAGLRKLQPRYPLHASGGLKPSADAAVRLAAVEVTSQQTAAQLTNTARQMDKLQARVRLATSDLKQPIRAAQGAAAQQAAALLKLSEQQALLQKQVDGSQELIAALQGLAAKQFKVSAEALQQLKQGQAQLSGSTNKALRELQQQQQQLHQQIQAQQQLLSTLQRQQAAALQGQMQQQAQQLPDHQVVGAGPGGSSSGSSGASMHPDPWQPTPAADPKQAPQDSASGGGSSSRSNSSGVDSHADGGLSGSPSSQLPTSNGRERGHAAHNAGLNGTSAPATSAAQ